MAKILKISNLPVKSRIKAKLNSRKSSSPAAENISHLPESRTMPPEQFPPLMFKRGISNPTVKDVVKDYAVQELYWMLKGNYKKFKQAKINYADFAIKHFDEIKTLTKKDMPNAYIHPLSPLFPFYALRTARILITDAFRKKTPAEIKLKELLTAYKKTKSGNEYIN